jgi:hypothetical protein
VSELVNLRQIRKRKARERAALEATERREKFGAAPGARRAETIRLEFARRKLEAHRLDRPNSVRAGDEE